MFSSLTVINIIIKLGYGEHKNYKLKESENDDHLIFHNFFFKYID